MGNCTGNERRPGDRASKNSKEKRDMTTPTNGESVLAEYMSRDELAEDLNRCTRTLDRWHSLRIGPPRTIIGKRVLYRRQAVAEWLRFQEEPPPSSRAA